jgi:NADH-quinone oxidoreductase subunit N
MLFNKEFNHNTQNLINFAIELIYVNIVIYKIVESLISLMNHNIINKATQIEFTVLVASVIWLMLVAACIWIKDFNFEYVYEALIIFFSSIMFQIILFCMDNWNIIFFEKILIYNQFFLLDPISNLIKILASYFFYVSCVMLKPEFSNENDVIGIQDLVAALPFLLLTVMILSCTIDLLIIFISFELLTIFIIFLSVILSLNDKTGDAVVTYYMFNVFVSTLYLFGLLLLFFNCQTYNLFLIANYVQVTYSNSFFNYVLLKITTVTLILFCIGFFFKTGVFPTHFYVPALYMSSKSVVINFFSTVIKASCLLVIIRLNIYLFDKFDVFISVLFMFIGIISLALGAISAYTTKDIRCFIGYTSINHFGFMFFIISVNSAIILSWAILYNIFYNNNLTCFNFLINGNKDTTNYTYFSDLLFTSLESYLNCFSLIIIAYIFSAIPPSPLFLFKYEIFENLISFNSNFIYSIAFILFINSISVWYYLKIIAITLSNFEQNNKNYEAELKIYVPTFLTYVFLIFIIGNVTCCVWVYFSIDNIIELLVNVFNDSLTVITTVDDFVHSTIILGLSLARGISNTNNNVSSSSNSDNKVNNDDKANKDDSSHKSEQKINNISNKVEAISVTKEVWRDLFMRTWFRTFSKVESGTMVKVIHSLPEIIDENTKLTEKQINDISITVSKEMSQELTNLLQQYLPSIVDDMASRLGRHIWKDIPEVWSSDDEDISSSAYKKSRRKNSRASINYKNKHDIIVNPDDTNNKS